MTKLIKKLEQFIQFEAASGILLIIMTFLAIFLANSQASAIYAGFLHAPVVISFGPFKFDHSFEHFVNDALMTIFFLIVSLEIKREIIEGHLSTRDQQIIPAVGALGGVLIPAGLYILININNDVYSFSTISGWAIPSATDIAFALGVLSLFGKRVPVSLKVFLTALAIIDDLAAIIIIALFYNSNLNEMAFLWGAYFLIILAMMNIYGVTRKSPYLIIGLFLWICVLESGLHATLSGVMLGLFIPLRAKDIEGKSPLKSLEDNLHHFVAFFILPLFAFVNAGVSLKGFSFFDAMRDPIALGIIVGLFIGKQLGVFTTIYLLVKSGLAKMPEKASWGQIYGISLLTGIGFTMSIFIGNLAFPENPEVINIARVGILIASFMSAIAGYIVLDIVCKKAPKKKNVKAKVV